MIMQNLYVVEGRPAWSSQFIIAAINSCGRYSPLRFEIVDKGEIDVSYVTKKWDNSLKPRAGYVETKNNVRVRNLICTAWAIEKETQERLESAPISIELAVKEGWFGKNGSKWQTMPEQMLRYRAASFFGRIYAPELLMGIRSAEEEVDSIIDVTPAAPEPEPVTTETVKQRRGSKSTPASQPATETVETAPVAEADTQSQQEPESDPVGVKPTFDQLKNAIASCTAKPHLDMVVDQVHQHENVDEQSALYNLATNKRCSRPLCSSQGTGGHCTRPRPASSRGGSDGCNVHTCNPRALMRRGYPCPERVNDRPFRTQQRAWALAHLRLSFPHRKR
jgi:hypothetical protein